MATPATEIAVAGTPGLPVGARASEELLHDDRVHPAVVDPALLPVHADRAEAKRLVEPEPRRVAGQGGEHQLVIAVPAGELDEPGEELAADALAAPAALARVEPSFRPEPREFLERPAGAVAQRCPGARAEVALVPRVVERLGERRGHLVVRDKTLGARPERVELPHEVGNCHHLAVEV